MHNDVNYIIVYNKEKYETVKTSNNTNQLMDAFPWLNIM